jgi:glycosyltransferase involved in cell wall biosynthesis
MSRFNVGGTSQFLFHLSHELQSKGYENLLLVGDCAEIESEDNRLSELRHSKLKGLGPNDSPLASITAIFRIRKVIKDFRPDVINTHTSKAGFLGRLANLTLKTRPTLTHTFHGHVFHGYFNSFIERVVKYIERLLMHLTDYVFVVGERVLHDLQQLKIVTDKPVTVVWPYVPEFSLGDRNELRKNLGITEGDLVVGWLGRKVPIKRLDRIVELSRRLPHCFFLIAGDGNNYLPESSKYLTSHKDKNLIEIGVSTPESIWAISDICLSVSDNEGIPISPIESSLAGKPVVATNVGSSDEVVINGITGFLCAPNVDSIYSSLVLLLENADLRQEFGMNAYTFAKAKFDSERCLQTYIDGYAFASALKSGVIKT